MKKKVKALIFMKEKSERLPGKNYKNIAGKPLLYWILKSLSGSKRVSEIIVNTDSLMIADLCKQITPVKIHNRPDFLLDINHNEASQIIKYDIDKLEGEHFLHTHATNPILRSSTIDNAIDSYFKSIDDHDSLFSVTPFQKRIFNDKKRPINHDPMKMIKTQELPTYYEENSCLYIFSRSSFKKTKSRIGLNPQLFPISMLEAVDIDTYEDFVMANAILENKSKIFGSDSLEIE